MPRTALPGSLQPWSVLKVSKEYPPLFLGQEAPHFLHPPFLPPESHHLLKEEVAEEEEVAAEETLGVEVGVVAFPEVMVVEARVHLTEGGSRRE